MITRETDSRKQESNTSDNQNTKASSSSTTSWSRLKDPRIVRVSRAFGGKDRHSKVCTVRGLRDRRVRLSVPTAIQLYDLQDRLGLSQPSKVVDWLLNAAKNEIDELPPLQIPPGAFINNNPSLVSMLNCQSDKQGLKIGAVKSPEGTSYDFNLENQESGYDNFPVSRQNHTTLLNNSMASASYNSFVRWDPSNLTLSHPPRSHELSSHEDWHNFNLIPLQSGVSAPSGSHQVFVYQPQPYFPSQVGGSNAELDSKQLHFQSAELSHDESNTSQSARPIHFNMLPSQNNDGR